MGGWVDVFQHLVPFPPGGKTTNQHKILYDFDNGKSSGQKPRPRINKLFFPKTEKQGINMVKPVTKILKIAIFGNFQVFSNSVQNIAF